MNKNEREPHPFITQDARVKANERRSAYATEHASQNLELFSLLSKPASIGNEQLARDRTYNTAFVKESSVLCPICGEWDCKYTRP